jgi:hypothetical protein
MVMGRADLRCTEVEQFEDDSLLELRFCRSRAATAGRPGREVRRSRVAVVFNARIGAAAQKGLDCGRTPVSNGSMEWRHTTGRR